MRYSAAPIALRLTDEQRTALEAIAAELGTTLSAVVRDAALVAVGLPHLADSASVVRLVDRTAARTAVLARPVTPRR